MYIVDMPSKHSFLYQYKAESNEINQFVILRYSRNKNNFELKFPLLISTNWSQVDYLNPFAFDDIQNMDELNALNW